MSKVEKAEMCFSGGTLWGWFALKVCSIFMGDLESRLYCCSLQVNQN